MPTNQSFFVLRRLAGPPPGVGDDEELLRKFCVERDEGAFTVIVRRHGGLVLDVCRSVLRNEADAEDAFQATFVTLAADARRIRRPAALAGWLHGVAWRISGKARRARERRRVHEAQSPARPDMPADDPTWAEVRQAIHLEVNRLPERYRAAIVLFYLAGRTQDDVSRVLGLSTAGAKKRLERGRALLRTALDRRGFGPTVALAATAIALPTTSMAVAETAAKLAIGFVTNRSIVPAAVLSLVSNGVRPMVAKLAFGTAAFLGVATTVGLGVLHGGPGGQPARDGDSPVVAQVKSPDGAGEPERKEKSPRSFDPDSSPRKETNALRLDQAMTRFRAYEPAERLKVVEKIAGADKAFAAAKKGDLIPGIVERGAVEAATYVDVSCTVKAKDKNTSFATTIRWLIDDGSMVKKGDRLAELDNSWIREQLQVATLKTNEAKAANAQAAENLRLARQDHEIEQRLAAIDVKLAEIDLKDAPKEKKEVLELKVEQASLKLERAKARGRAQVVQAEADLSAKKAALEMAAKLQREVEDDLSRCVILAPADGIAVYYVPSASRFGMTLATIAPGEPVREGQKLLRIADLKKFVIATRVHEALISTVRVGQETLVKVDAFPGRAVKGKVTHVSPVASNADWQRSDAKLYPVTISIDEALPGLKPSMSGEVHITTGERKAVVQVPVKAVVSHGRDQICFVKSGTELIDRKVVTGARNADFIEIKEGLKEGDVILADLPALFVRPQIDRPGM